VVPDRDLDVEAAKDMERRCIRDLDDARDA
jgi:hypothetical protein